MVTHTLRPFLLFSHLVISQRLVPEDMSKRVEFSLAETIKLVIGVILQVLVLMFKYFMGKERRFVVVHVVEELLGSEFVYLFTSQFALTFSLKDSDYLLHLVILLKYYKFKGKTQLLFIVDIMVIAIEVVLTYYFQNRDYCVNEYGG